MLNWARCRCLPPPDRRPRKRGYPSFSHRKKSACRMP